ncbi:MULTISPECIES: S-methyl-5'-thioadenosine phosphorylase [Protofrankia]|uniref:Purine nucleoside phosphorylase n=1 Tax=Protofrankia coriariae TaxID=1562887 RepID=A0ABR5EZE2_9ACTN|nr:MULTISPECIES: S-methyl-5'-thioadenosine phosphorylase [Protofrankia]KLL09807.1 purine nucleoside phosphorylase [Protofrankia coriariae]ONH31542.1 methylthioadenosine phosphorylase [Protofrankia sp. BMG5.30]
MTRAEISVIGGTGLYSFLEDATDIQVTTPYGEPSDPIAVGSLDGRPVAFLARHGRDHRFPAHRVNYRANLWALRSLGVRQVIAPAAVGSLRPELGPGTFVLPDQLVDRTSGRATTFYDEGAVHVSFADPYCPAARTSVLKAGTELGVGVVDGGTMVVVPGPRFSTRAESRFFAGQGWSLVNMTGHPEAVLARELALCYVSIALVTDHDAGVDGGTSVAQADVFEVFARSVDTLRELVRLTVAALPSTRECACPTALDGMTLPLTLP